jgi:hypothetical protein
VFEGVGFVDVVLATQFHHETECGVYVRHFVKGAVCLFMLSARKDKKISIFHNAPYGGITKTNLKSKLDVLILNNFLRAT